MAQFQVPQFIETEDTIVGPLTIRQFGYLLAGGAIIFILYLLLNFWFWVILSTPLTLLTLTLAFIKYNNRPIAGLLLSALKYFWEPRIYLFQKEGGGHPGGGLKNLIFQMMTSSEKLPSLLDRFKSTKERFEFFRKITGEREAARRVDYR